MLSTTRITLLLASLVRRTNSTTRAECSFACLSALNLRGLNSSVHMLFSTLSVGCFNGVNFVQSRDLYMFQNQSFKSNITYSNLPFIQKRNFCTSNDSNNNNNNNDNKEITLSPFSKACKSGDIEQVQEFLKEGVDVNELSDGFPALFLASTNGHLEIVKLLVENGADVNIRDDVGLTPLMGALQRGHPEVAKFLLENGANPSALSHNNDQRPIDCAVSSNNIDVVKVLFEHGVTLHGVNGESLHIAVHKNNFEMVKLLLRHGASVCSVNSKGQTPLHVSIQEAQLDIFKELVSNDHSALTLQDKYKMNVLHYCAIHDRLDIAQYILTHLPSLSTDVFNSFKETPLHIATSLQKIEMVKLLLNHKANPKTQNSKNKTPFQTAVENSDVELVELLLQYNNSNPDS